MDQENQGNTLVSVAPLIPPPETEEKPSENGEAPEAPKTEPAPPPTNGHSTAKTADTELWSTDDWRMAAQELPPLHHPTPPTNTTPVRTRLWKPPFSWRTAVSGSCSFALINTGDLWSHLHVLSTPSRVSRSSSASNLQPKPSISKKQNELTNKIVPWFYWNASTDGQIDRRQTAVPWNLLTSFSERNPIGLSSCSSDWVTDVCECVRESNPARVWVNMYLHLYCKYLYMHLHLLFLPCSLYVLYAWLMWRDGFECACDISHLNVYNFL